MRLDKLLGNMGFGSRKEVKEMVKRGEVKVNDQVVNQSAIKIDIDKDKVTISGEEVIYQEYIYLMMNKPKGYICATDDSYNATVLELLEPMHRLPGIHPVGRLDKDTTGLLLLTNDGKFTFKITSPKKDIEKVYYARLDGRIDEKCIENFEKGIYITEGDYTSKPAKLEEIALEDGEYLGKVTISEGKYHQVKNMFKSQGLEVLDLMRAKIGEVDLDDDLEEGEYRLLTDEEIESFL